MRRLTLGLALLTLAGCGTAADLTGLAVGGAAGGITANPAVGYAVGVGTRAGVDWVLLYASRVRQGAEQDAIAAAAGGLPRGGQAPWHIDHTIPFGNEAGLVVPVREIATSLATCREVAFSIHDDPPAPEAWFTTTICRAGDHWKWAQAEPAVERWGYLQ